jgi:hypothetical protein
VTVAPTTALKLGKSCWIDILSEEIGRITVAGEVRHVAGRRVGLETTRPVPVASFRARTLRTARATPAAARPWAPAPPAPAPP